MKDWKFWVMLVATVAAIFVPVWLWRADISSKALVVRLVSEVNLQPYTSKALQGVEVSFGGEKIDAPHLTILEVENTGAKAITSSDWETPLELHPEKKVRVLRAELGESSVTSLRPSLDHSEKTVYLRPLLLNAGDRFSIVILTSGSFSDFTPIARIAGIADIEVEKRSRERTQPVVTWVMLAVGCLSSGMLLIAVRGLWGREKLTFGRGASLLCLIVSSAAMIVYIVSPLRQFQMSVFFYAASYFAICVIGGVIGMLAMGLLRKRVTEI